MDASVWVAKTGLTAQQRRMTVIANNLANVNTVAFKRDRAVFEDLLYQNIRQPGASADAQTIAPTGLMMGTGSRIIATEKLHEQGNMMSTENALDVAILGRGMFQILQADGTFAYTRDGSFKRPRHVHESHELLGDIYRRPLKRPRLHLGDRGPTLKIASLTTLGERFVKTICATRYADPCRITQQKVPNNSWWCVRLNGICSGDRAIVGDRQLDADRYGNRPATLAKHNVTISR